MSMPVPVIEGVGAHGSLKVGTTANTVNTIAVKGSCHFEVTIQEIQKDSPSDGGDAEFELGLRSATLTFTPRHTPAAPFAYAERDTIYFEDAVSGIYKYTGHGSISKMPMEWDVNGDAKTPVTVKVRSGWTRNTVPVS